MNTRILMRRVRRFAVRTVLVPVLAASAWLGVTSGGHAKATLSPAPTQIATALATGHELPKGTSLSVGNAKRKTTLAFDEQGRILITPPKGETFGTVFSRGFGQLGSMAGSIGGDLSSISLPSGTQADGSSR